jgi:hypothetical protein
MVIESFSNVTFDEKSFFVNGVVGPVGGLFRPVPVKFGLERGPLTFIDILGKFDWRFIGFKCEGY